jgi:hypothetical protein
MFGWRSIEVCCAYWNCWRWFNHITTSNLGEIFAMKRIIRTLYLTKEAIDLIDKDINAKESYTFFANKEQDTVEVELTLSVLEEFRITEDVLMDIIQGLTPALSEKEHNKKFEEVLSHLRSISLSV